MTSPRPCGRPVTLLSKPCSQKVTLRRSTWRDHRRQVHSSRLQSLPWWKIFRPKIQTTLGKLPCGKALVNFCLVKLKNQNKILISKGKLLKYMVWTRNNSRWHCCKLCLFSFSGASNPMTKRLRTFSMTPWCVTRSATSVCWRTCGSGGQVMPSGKRTSPAWNGTKCCASRRGPTGEGQPGRKPAVFLSALFGCLFFNLMNFPIS